MLTHEDAQRRLERATFRINLGKQVDEAGAWQQYYGTGFFVTTKLALTAYHNFEGCNPDDVFGVTYQGHPIQLKWIQELSSEAADIALLRLHRNPDGVKIRRLKAAYLDIKIPLPARKRFFLEKGTVAIFGYPELNHGGTAWQIDGAVDSAQPILDVHEGERVVPRLCIHGSKIRKLQGISGAAILSRETEYVIGVQGSYDGEADVFGSEIAGLVRAHPELAQYFKVLRPDPLPPRPPKPLPPRSPDEDPERLKRIRKQLLSATAAYELHLLKYELEAYCRSFPDSAEARSLQRQVETALTREQRPERDEIKRLVGRGTVMTRPAHGSRGRRVVARAAALAVVLLLGLVGVWSYWRSVDTVETYVFDLEDEASGTMAWEKHVDTPKADQNRKAITELARSTERKHEGRAALRVGLDFDQTVDEIEISRDLTTRLPSRCLLCWRWLSRAAGAGDIDTNSRPPIDMSNTLITGYLLCRDDFPIGGQNPPSARLFLKDNDPDRRKFYGFNVNIDRGWIQLSLDTSTGPAKAEDKDAGFDPAMVRTIGIQLAQNSVAKVSYRGFCYVDDVGWAPS